MEEWKKSVIFWLAFYAIIIGSGFACMWVLHEFPIYQAPIQSNVSFLFNESVMLR